MKPVLKQILLIDDHQATNVFSKIILRKLNIIENIITQNSADKALVYLQKNSYEFYPNSRLIFLDLNMPGMDGWDFLDEYHNLPSNLREQSQIVMLSNSEDPCDLEKANKNQYVIAFRSKPISKDMVTELVQQYWPHQLR